MTYDVDRSVVTRLVWLVFVPIGSSFVPWIASAIDDWRTWGLVVVAVVPLCGFLSACAYALAAPLLPARLWPLVPYGLAAAGFLAFVINMVTLKDGDGLEGVPVVLIGAVQPLLALAGGVISFVWTSPKAFAR